MNECRRDTLTGMPSTVIRDFSYNVATRQLVVTFVTGRIYAYADVPPDVHNAFRASGSKGRSSIRRSATVTIAARSRLTILKKPLRCVWDRVTKRRRAGNKIGHQMSRCGPERQAPMSMAISKP